MQSALRNAQHYQEIYTDYYCHTLVFDVGDLVMLSICNIWRNMSRCFQKHFISLFPIIRKLSDVAYQLELPSHIAIHNIFHVLLLFPYNSLPSCLTRIHNLPAPPSHIDLDLRIAATVERILCH